jgi:hypothetical protein
VIVTFLALGIGCVRSNTRTASSNLIPLKFSGGSFGGVFLTGFFFFTVSFPAPTVADSGRLNKAILHPRVMRQ